MSASYALALKAGMGLIEREVDEMPLSDGLIVGIEKCRRLLAAIEYAERITFDEGGRGGCKPYHAGIEIFDHFGKAIENRTMRFIEYDEVEKTRRKLLVANAHRLLGRHIEPRVGIDVSRADAETRPATDLVDPIYEEVLREWRYQGRSDGAMTVKQFYLAVARLGGHMNRKRDGAPGWLVLWRGWMKLQSMVDGVEADRRRQKRRQSRSQIHGET